MEGRNNAKTDIIPHFMSADGNGILRCYNMVPTMFTSIEDMTAYLDDIHRLGFNTVWLNPIQETGEDGGHRTDKLTYQQYEFSNSLYAMKYDDTFDPCISMVKRTKEGAYLFTKEQKDILRIMSLAQLKEKFEISSFEELEEQLDESSKGILAAIKREREKCDLAVTQLKLAYSQAASLVETSEKAYQKLKQEQADLEQAWIQRTAHLAKPSSIDTKKNAFSHVDISLFKEVSAYIAGVSAYISPENIKHELETIKKELSKAGQQLSAAKEKANKLKHDLEMAPYNRDKEIRKINKKRIKLTNYFDTAAIKKFTERARQLGITPIFDLVLNHVATSSPLVVDHRDWFVMADDLSFADVRAFNYIQNTTKTPRLLSKKSNKTVIDDVFDHLWKGFVEKYIGQFGFDGVRIDCVRKLPFQLRAKIYEHIRDTLRNAKREAQYDPVILEELLFSDSKPLKDVINHDVNDAGGTHVTGSVFYKTREWHGGLPVDILEELGLKSSIVSCGAINFTGNHDHTPAANEVLVEMATTRFWNTASEHDPVVAKFKKAIEGFKQKREEASKNTDIKNKHIYKSRLQELDTKIKFYTHMGSYYFMQQIKIEMLDKNESTTQDFLMRLRDRIILNMFSGSAGYYLLTGDEVANTLPTEIYSRSHGGEVYPQRMHKLLQHPTAAVHNVLKYMVLESASLSQNLKSWCDEFNLAKNELAVNRILLPYIDFLIHTINSGDVIQQTLFAKWMLEKEKVRVTFNDDDFIATPRTHANHWQLNSERHYPDELGAFIREHHAIMQALPKPTAGTWSHSFKLPYVKGEVTHNHLIVTVRVNSLGMQGPAQVIITNLDPARPVIIDLKAWKEIAKYFQARCYPLGNVPEGTSYHDYYMHHHDYRDGFAKSWALIMGADKDESASNKPILYCNQGVNIDDDVMAMVTEGIIAPATTMPSTSLLDLPAEEFKIDKNVVDNLPTMLDDNDDEIKLSPRKK